MVKRKSWTEMDKSKIPFKELQSGFDVYNRTTNKSLRTVAWYNDKLDLFQRFLGGEAVLADVTVPNVRAFIAQLQGRTTRRGGRRM